VAHDSLTFDQRENEPVRILCPFCEDCTLTSGADSLCLVCENCRHRVYEVRICLPRLERLLRAFETLMNDFYGDKDTTIYVSDAYGSLEAELDARGAYADSRRIADVTFPPHLLSPTAARALNDLRQEYSFETGDRFIASLLEVLNRMEKRTPEQGRLRRQIDSMTPTQRESIVRAIEGC
jgi:hypothetical protein